MSMELSTQAYASALLNADPKDATHLLQQRFRDAEALTQELSDYFAARRALEASHARALAKLAKRPFFTTRDSAPAGVRPILDALVSELDALAQVYNARERAIGRFESQARHAPTRGAWAELPPFEDRLHDATRDLNLLDASFARESRKLDSSSSQLQNHAAQRVASMQRDLDHASSKWRQDAAPAFQLAQRADVERLTLIKEIVTQFETGAADSANQLAHAAEMALQAALGLDVEQEVAAFAQANKQRRPAPPPPSNSTRGVLPPSEALASSRGESHSRRDPEPEPTRSGSGSTEKVGGLRGALGRFGRKHSSQKEAPPVPQRTLTPESQASESPSAGAGNSLVRRGKTLLGGSSKRATKLFSNNRTTSPGPIESQHPEPIQEVSSAYREHEPADLLLDDGPASPSDSRFAPLQPAQPPTTTPEHPSSHVGLGAAGAAGVGLVGAGLGAAANGHRKDEQQSYDRTQPAVSSPAPPAASSPSADDDVALHSLRGTLAPPRGAQRRHSSSRRASHTPLYDAPDTSVGSSGAVAGAGAAAGAGAGAGSVASAGAVDAENPFGAKAEATPSSTATPAPVPNVADALLGGALKVKVVEKVNVYFTGNAVSRHLVVGEVEASLDPTALPPGSHQPVRVRLSQTDPLDRLVPNPAFLHPTSTEGEFNLQVDALSQADTIVLAKYQVHVDPEQQASYVPVHLQAQWRTVDAHTDLLLRYSASSKLGQSLNQVVLETTIAPGPVDHMQALPEGSWDAETSTARWTLDHAALAEGGVIRSRWFLQSGSVTPQPVKATWTAPATLANVNVAIVQETQLSVVPSLRSAQAGTYIAA